MFSKLDDAQHCKSLKFEINVVYVLLEYFSKLGVCLFCLFYRVKVVVLNEIQNVKLFAKVVY